MNDIFYVLLLSFVPSSISRNHFIFMVLIVLKLNDDFFSEPQNPNKMFAIKDMFNLFGSNFEVSDSKWCDLFNAAAHTGNSIPANYIYTYINGCLWCYSKLLVNLGKCQVPDPYQTQHHKQTWWTWLSPLGGSRYRWFQRCHNTEIIFKKNQVWVETTRPLVKNGVLIP